MITEQEVKGTNAFKKLNEFEQKFILKRKNIEIIDHTITVFRNTNYINENIGGKNLSIVKEILKLN